MDNISDAIESIYQLNSEYVLMTWNFIPILLTYKYDISIIMEDILKMLSLIRLNNKGKMQIAWPSNTFASTWNLSWKNEVIKIESEWITVIGSTEQLLNKECDLSIKLVDFQAEWKKLLEQIICDLSSCGYNSEIRGMQELKIEYEQIKEYGQLYK